jgi:ACS family glucarate transporter-like MFS transporter
MSDVYAGKATKMRWVMVILAFFAILTNYMDRANLAIALPYMNGELHLTSGESGLILGAFFWTYAAFQVPAGMLVDRLGARVVFAGAVLWWSLFTMATTIARGTFSLLGVRLLLGVGEAGAFPAATKLVERWFPATERGLASGIYDCGARGGTLIAIPLCTAVILAWGWRASFIVTGAIGLAWVLVWLILSTEYPAQNKRTNEAEVRLIEHLAASVPRQAQAKISWFSLLRSRMVWAMSLGFACQGYVIYFFITWYPTYLVKERGFTLLQLGLFGILPGIAGLIGSWFGGWLSDRIARSSLGLNVGRKFCIVLGMAMSAVIGFAGLASQDWLALILLSISFFGVSIATSSILALPADISAKGEASVAGTVAGFQNCIGNLAGIVSPAVIGYLRDATGSFTPGLVSASVVAIMGCLIYIFFVGTITEGALDARVAPEPAVAPGA